MQHSVDKYNINYKYIYFFYHETHVIICFIASPMNVWLSGDLAAQQLDIKEVLSNLPLPINSIDVSGERLIFGGDNEALYYIQKLLL